MIFEMRTYQLKPGALANYVRHFEKVGLPIVSRYCSLAAYWIAESGALNRVIHVWSFDDLEARRQAHERWMTDPDWAGLFLPVALPMVVSQESIYLSAASFSPIR
ncbi:NIPSNAP family protein [Roseiarcaceae bacterium H3SJ34-1]|uniref:NIPSNAP family protein n=1 Tax=Terripilifer ovatus TaxID=3032367 RepID=UPI003AB9383C|nr:NIPSNAP family protein [Roseiarcaceae bacterium H3SJ34-1]